MMKIFVSDLDGTMIDQSLQNNDAVKACVQQILHSKNELVIATGRSLHGIKVLNFYDAPIYFIIMNGAILLDRNKAVLYKKAIDERVVRAAYHRYPNDNVEYITQNKTFMAISKEAYLMNYGQWDVWQKKMSGNDEQFQFMLSHYVFDADISQIKDQVVKINILDMDAKKYKEKEAFFKTFDEVVNNPFDTHVLELTAAGVTKQSTMDKLLQLTGWHKNNIYVFGDGDNDAMLLAAYDHSYAVDNASEKAKNSAKYIIGSCKDNAVINQIAQIMTL